MDKINSTIDLLVSNSHIWFPVIIKIVQIKMLTNRKVESVNVEKNETKNIEETEDISESGEDNGSLKKTRKTYNRDMRNYFTDGQRIRHIIPKSKNTWIGTYSFDKNQILCNGQIYTSLGKFVDSHFTNEDPNCTTKRNGWNFCDCEVDNKWMPTKTLNRIPRK